MKKHTPGPWKMEREYKGSHEWEITDHNNKKSDITAVWIATVWNDYPGPDSPADANARLIAAAPQMLEALRDLHDCQNGPPLSRHKEEWEEAMEKTRGLLSMLDG